MKLRKKFDHQAPRDFRLAVTNRIEDAKALFERGRCLWTPWKEDLPQAIMRPVEQLAARVEPRQLSQKERSATEVLRAPCEGFEGKE